jgi:SAM-dependent methyltransferase
MINPVKRIVPHQLKHSLRATFNTWTDCHPIADQVRQLERKLEESEAAYDETSTQLRTVVGFLRNWMMAMLPDPVLPSGEGLRRTAQLLATRGIDSNHVNLAISKYDSMFNFLVGKCGCQGRNIDSAFVEYYQSGLHMLDVVDAIVAHRFGSYANVGSVLDFAGGFGRMTRFLVGKHEPVRVWVSDIKSSAVEFQQAQFGVRGFVSTLEPEELIVSEQFDLIFVASLFSHLPEATFGRWVRRLWDMLTPSGLLVFSANDTELLPELLRRPIYYKTSSEEMIARDDDGSPDGSQYGSTYVNEQFVGDIIGRLDPRVARWGRYPQCLWYAQDLYVLSRAVTDLTTLDLPHR